MDRLQTKDSDEIYRTFSICPKCVFINQQGTIFLEKVDVIYIGLEWKPASVVHRNNNVWLVLKYDMTLSVIYLFPVVPSMEDMRPSIVLISIFSNE